MLTRHTHVSGPETGPLQPDRNRNTQTVILAALKVLKATRERLLK